MQDRLVLEIPPIPEHVATARLFLGAVARHFGYEEELVDDLKIAVSEACSMTVRDRSSTTPIHLEVHGGPAGLRVEVLDPEAPGLPDAPAEEATPDSYSRTISADVILSLFPEATFETPIEGGRRVTFSLVPA